LNNALPSQQIAAINQQLTTLLLQKYDAEAKLAEANTGITALRNLLGGVGLGQELQKQILVEQAPPAMVAAQVAPPVLSIVPTSEPAPTP
jgi:hypothetical protein